MGSKYKTLHTSPYFMKAVSQNAQQDICQLSNDWRIARRDFPVVEEYLFDLIQTVGVSYHRTHTEKILVLEVLGLPTNIISNKP
jgi:hypothetical protein